MSDGPQDQGAPTGPPGPGAPGGPGRAPRTRRTGLIVGIVAVALVVVVGIAIGLVALLSDGGKPSDTVRAYLQALADGNAPRALEQGTKAPDTSFATSAALEAQRAIARISSIHVDDGSRSGNRARVTATYRFGEKQADATYTLTRVDGDWKIDDTLYPIDLSDLDAVPGLTLLGVGTAGRATAYVFPGPLVWGSTDRYLAVTEQNPDDFTLSPSDGSSASSTLRTTLTPAGQKAAAQAVTTYLSACARSKDLQPAGCPQSEGDYAAVAGTATWTPPTDLRGLQYRTGTPVTEVYVSGDLTWSVTYTAEDFSGARTTVAARGVPGSLSGTVDLSRNPPVYSP